MSEAKQRDQQQYEASGIKTCANVTIVACLKWTRLLWIISINQYSIGLVDARSLRFRRGLSSYEPTSQPSSSATYANLGLFPDSNVHQYTSTIIPTKSGHANVRSSLQSIISGNELQIVSTSANYQTISSRQQHRHFFHTMSADDTATNAAELDHKHPYHEPTHNDHHEQEYHLHVHYVIFTSWWYLVALAIVEVVVYLITLLIIRSMNRTRTKQRRSNFTWRYTGNRPRL
ncbi:uncharacterized protein [Amphiura filiformis]|uniref:uncharacterized protein n=1 Tax=Amphiura filiformis TaxID=82378 RepID=UPI003B224E59